jgi:dUTP pyrophosphatase
MCHVEAESPSEPLRVKRLSEHALMPCRSSEHAAGYDLFAAHSAEVPPGGRALIRTDIAIAVPAGTYGRVAPRSGLALKHGVHLGAGVVDRDYRGNVGVVLFNLGEELLSVERGMRIAQLVLERIVTPPVVEVQELEDTVRGGGGFGSTGV